MQFKTTDSKAVMPDAEDDVIEALVSQRLNSCLDISDNKRAPPFGLSQMRFPSMLRPWVTILKTPQTSWREDSITMRIQFGRILTATAGCLIP